MAFMRCKSDKKKRGGGGEGTMTDRIMLYVTKIYNNRPFPSSLGPLFENEGRCSAFDMEIIFYSHANKTH